MEYLMLAGIVLLIMALFMRFRKLHVLILRYEFFQNVFRKRSFTVDEEGLAQYYTYLFIFAGISLIVYRLIRTNELLAFWGSVVYIVIIVSIVLHLNLTTRFLIFDEDN